MEKFKSTYTYIHIFQKSNYNLPHQQCHRIDTWKILQALLYKKCFTLYKTVFKHMTWSISKKRTKIGKIINNHHQCWWHWSRVQNWDHLIQCYLYMQPVLYYFAYFGPELAIQSQNSQLVGSRWSWKSTSSCSGVAHWFSYKE